MDNLRLEGDRISKYAICQAHRQLEVDYGFEGVLLQRPSNIRRGKSSIYQLERIKMRHPYSLWVDIVAEPVLGQPILMEQVRFVYLLNVLKLGLPHDLQLRSVMRRMLSKPWLSRHHPEILRPEVLRAANCTRSRQSRAFSALPMYLPTRTR